MVIQDVTQNVPKLFFVSYSKIVNFLDWFSSVAYSDMAAIEDKFILYKSPL